MFRLFYQWRYKRSQRVGAFKLPSIQTEGHEQSVNLGSYLSQSSVSGRNFERFDLSKTTGRWIKWLLAAGGLVFFIWLVHESLAAMAIF